MRNYHDHLEELKNIHFVIPDQTFIFCANRWGWLGWTGGRIRPCMKPLLVNIRHRGRSALIGWLNQSKVSLRQLSPLLADLEHLSNHHEQVLLFVITPWLQLSFCPRGRRSRQENFLNLSPWALSRKWLYSREVSFKKPSIFYTLEIT